MKERGTLIEINWNPWVYLSQGNDHEDTGAHNSYGHDYGEQGSNDQRISNCKRINN